MDNKMKVFVVLLGLLLTLATGLLDNAYIVGEFPDVQVAATPILGAGYSGMPLPWMTQVVYPDSPVNIIYPNLIVDLVFWVLVVFVIKLFYLTVIKGEKKSRKAAPRRVRPRSRSSSKRTVTRRKARPKRKTTRTTKRKTSRSRKTTRKTSRRTTRKTSRRTTRRKR